MRFQNTLTRPHSWLTQILGRASELNSFVKIGATDGYIEIELKGKIGKKNLVVRRSLTAASKGSTYSLNGQSATGREVTQKMNELNVQVGNLWYVSAPPPTDHIHLCREGDGPIGRGRCTTPCCAYTSHDPRHSRSSTRRSKNSKHLRTAMLFSRKMSNASTNAKISSKR
jgi:hypothetical protein